MVIIPTNHTMIKKAKIEQETINFVLGSFEARIKDEMRNEFILFSEPLQLSLKVKKTNKDSDMEVEVTEIIVGDIYINSGMLTQAYSEKKGAKK